MNKTSMIHVRVSPEIKQEAEEMEKHPENYKSYKNLAKMMEDLDMENKNK